MPGLGLLGLLNPGDVGMFTAIGQTIEEGTRFRVADECGGEVVGHGDGT